MNRWSGSDARAFNRIGSALIAVLALAWPTAASGQQFVDFGAACVDVGGAQAACRAAAVAAEWLTSDAGLLATGVALTPAPERTLGYRTQGGAPRSALDIRIGFAPIRHPDLSADAPERALERTQVALSAGFSMGLFDGFQPYPTLGGVLSADAFGGYTWIPWSESDGYDRASNYRTVGVRIGLMRESFSVPGIAVSASRSWGSTLIYAGDPAIASVQPAVTAVRLALGKDVYGVGVHGSLGRNWTDATARIGGDFGSGQVFTQADLDASRTVANVGASLNFLVVQIQGDLGWGLGAGGPELPGFAASENPWFGALSVRLLL